MIKKRKKPAKNIKKRKEKAEKFVKSLYIGLIEKYGRIRTKKMLEQSVESSCAIEREE